MGVGCIQAQDASKSCMIDDDDRCCGLIFYSMQYYGAADRSCKVPVVLVQNEKRRERGGQ